MSIGENIRAMRKRAKLTQEELAAMLDVKPSVISRYENGKIIPPVDRLDALTKILGNDIFYRLSRQEMLSLGYMDDAEALQLVSHANSAAEQREIDIVSAVMKEHMGMELTSNMADILCYFHFLKPQAQYIILQLANVLSGMPEYFKISDVEGINSIGSRPTERDNGESNE